MSHTTASNWNGRGREIITLREFTRDDIFHNFFFKTCLNQYSYTSKSITPLYHINEKKYLENFWVVDTTNVRNFKSALIHASELADSLNKKKKLFIHLVNVVREEDIYVSPISCMWIECKLGVKECRHELEIIDGILELQLKWLNLIISEQQ